MAATLAAVLNAYAATALAASSSPMSAATLAAAAIGSVR
jgi:hypothetical protein